MLILKFISWGISHEIIKMHVYKKIRVLACSNKNLFLDYLDLNCSMGVSSVTRL